MRVTQKLASALAAGLTVIAAVPATSASAAGSFTPFFVPGSSPSGITIGLDRNLWFADASGNMVRLTTAGSSTVFPIPDPGTGNTPFPTDVALGPDGNVWFVDAFGSGIGRITRAGSINEFLIPTGDMLSGIAPGWDGGIWFGSRMQGIVGRLSLQGAYTGFQIQPADGTHDPMAATIGPRRSVWVSDESAGIIWQVSASGVLTPHPLPNSSVQPGKITVGPDGNLWFGESSPSGFAIGRMTPNGVVSQFPITGFVGGIAPGLDGKIWFTDEFNGKIGSVTMRGVVTEFDIPIAGAVPHGITTGPDGNIWFTDAGNAAVWRLTIRNRR